VDVSAVAGLLGGGGHVRAAGFGFEGSADDAIAALTAALDEGYPADRLDLPAY
jgi:bifunctional oligoribonuclease and PAP phosphatase NrnA